MVEKTTGWRRPSSNDVDSLVRSRKANTFQYNGDGVIPNHPHWPLIVYCGALKLPRQFDPAAIFEDVFERNGWGSSWRNGMYDYVHYHSRIHEGLGVARGSGKVQFGGQRGRVSTLKAGDVPAPLTTALAPATTFWLSAPTRLTALMTNAPQARTTREQSGRFPRSRNCARIPSTERGLLDLWKASRERSTR
ncbi:hypothetical protein [Mesorhizobium sp. M7A.F.Ca.ET.027.03.2.1]|uniref:hypothetical protein n=1 Tax=Mesorhizobium sp. M7A.F.Ca.ET.027.03.2.1 TaxID=2496656 RepID=UPI0032AF5A11